MRFNNNSFMSKALRKAFMHRLKLTNVCNKNRTKDNWTNYKKQRNFCANLLRKTKTEYFRKLNVKDLSDNRKFWKTMKPFFRFELQKTNGERKQPTYYRRKRVSHYNEYLFRECYREFRSKER